MPKRILLIVEGEADEVRFFKRLFSVCHRKTEYSIVSYKSNIHVIAQKLHDMYPDFEDDEVDIRSVLSSMIRDDAQKQRLYQNYTDVYMVFDLEPHHDRTHYDTVKRMLRYFCDPTNHGKLYINYPMMQSYKHFASLPDNGFASRRIAVADCGSYKRIVGDMSGFKDLAKYDYSTFYSMAVHHIRKANLLLTGSYSTPSAEEYLSFDHVKIYDAELEKIRTTGEVSVLNTSIFELADYAPERFFDFVSKRSGSLLI